MKSIKTIPENLKEDVKKTVRLVFGNLNQIEIDSILFQAEWIQLKSGEFLFHQGDTGRELYIVIQGKLKVQRSVNGQIISLKELLRGEVVGEMAIISETNRNADVIALRHSYLIAISKSEFESLYLKYPNIGLFLSKMIIQRLQPKPRERQSRHLRNIALYPSNIEIDIKYIIDQLKTQFSDKNILIINAKTDLEIAEDDESETSWIQTMNRLEKKYELFFLITDNYPSQWTSFCFGQADEVLVLCKSGDPAFKKEKLPDYNECTLEISFVIIHENDDDMPHNTAALLGQLRYNKLFHLRKNNSWDFRRVARHIRQETTGLVLAGGGARGMAHLGVWKALKEAKIEVDMIGGVSMGAFLGGVMAFDWDFETIYEICREISVSNPSRDFNPVPYASFIKGQKLNRILKKYYLRFDIEDCVIPFYCISSDPFNFVPYTHTKENMFRAIRASGSLPGIVPPVPVNGQWHVDGAIFNNFPVDIMIQSGIQKIIGSSFLTIEDSKTLHKEIPTVRDQFRHGFLKTDSDYRIPSMIETVMQSTLANSYQKQKLAEKQVDLLILPDVSKYGLLDWKSFKDVVEIGYKEAVKVLGR